MISWLFTVDPQTKIVSSASATNLDGDPFSASESYEENFFFTSQSIAGDFSSTTYETLRGSEPLTTLATTNVSRQISSTTVTTAVRQVYTTRTTASNSATITVSSVSTLSQTLPTFSTTTSNHSSFTTTTTDSQYVGELYGTIYMAQSDEVLLVASATDIGENIYSGAAIETASTATATTVYPQSETVAASIIAQSAVPSRAFTNTEESTRTTVVRQFSIGELLSSTRPVINPFAPSLPLETEEYFYYSPTTYGETITITDVEGSFLAYNYSATETTTTQYVSFVEITSLGQVFDSTYAVYSTTTAAIEDTSYTTSRAITAAGANPGEFEITEKWEKTTYAPRTKFYNQTTTAQTNERTIIGFTGIKNSAGVAASFFKQGIMQNVFGDNDGAWFVSVSQKVFSLMPGTFRAHNSDYQLLGTISFSNYSATLTSTGLSGTETTSQTQTAEFVPQGQATTDFIDFATAQGCLSINSLNTAYNSFASGVYRKKNGQTTKETFAIRSFSGGSTIDRYSPVTFFGYDTGTSTQIVWAAPRNSIAVP
jgi:hypothetical protein